MSGYAWWGQSVNPPLKIGTRVKPWGRVAAVLLTGGERYYHLIDRQGVVSMMPASMIEPCVPEYAARLEAAAPTPASESGAPDRPDETHG